MYSNYTLSFILNGLILLIGLFGNVIVMIIFSSKALKKFPSRNLYRALVIFDSLTLIYNISNEFLINFEIIWYSSSGFLSKIFFYCTAVFLTPYFLVFISIERFITIRYSNIKTFRNPKFQTIIIFVLIGCNLIVYHPILYTSTPSKIILVNNNTSNQYNYTVKYNEYIDLSRVIDLWGILILIFLAALPFIIMLIFSILLIHTIFKSRLRILRLTNQHDRKKLKKDIQFAFSSIFMNLFYFILFLPLCFFLIFKKYDVLDKTEIWNVFYSLSFFNLCDHFYILFCFNSIFRQEVIILFRLNPRLYQANVH